MLSSGISLCGCGAVSPAPRDNVWIVDKTQNAAYSMATRNTRTCIFKHVLRYRVMQSTHTEMRQARVREREHTPTQGDFGIAHLLAYLAIAHARKGTRNDSSSIAVSRSYCRSGTALHLYASIRFYSLFFA